MTDAMLLAIGTVLGSALGGILARPSLLDGLRRGKKFEKLVGPWNSAWIEERDPNTTYQEIINITRQKGDRIWGIATRESEPGKKWSLEGFYHGQFIQLLYSPSQDSENTTFLDYGCYFLQRKGQGQFVGYSTGYGPSGSKPEEDTLSTDHHEIRRLK